MDENRALNILLVEDDEVDIKTVQRAWEKAKITNALFIANDGLELVVAALGNEIRGAQFFVGAELFRGGVQLVIGMRDLDERFAGRSSTSSSPTGSPSRMSPMSDSRSQRPSPTSSSMHTVTAPSPGPSA